MKFKQKWNELKYYKKIFFISVVVSVIYPVLLTPIQYLSNRYVNPFTQVPERMLVFVSFGILLALMLIYKRTKNTNLLRKSMISSLILSLVYSTGSYYFIFKSNVEYPHLVAVFATFIIIVALLLLGFIIGYLSTKLEKIN